MAAEIFADVCIVGAGITGVLIAKKLSEYTHATVIVVDAGDWVDPGESRAEKASRFFQYGENPYPGDVIEEYIVPGAIHQTMAIGGRATHWPGITPRYAPQDFKNASIYGEGEDWPIDYESLEPYYCQAEWEIGVSGDPEHGIGFRSRPYPMPPFPLGFNRASIKSWFKSRGIQTWISPTARNSEPYDGRPQCAGCDSCFVCPIGARYSPDVTLARLVTAGRVSVRARTFVQRLEADSRTGRIRRVFARDRVSGDELSISANRFVLATSTHWTPYLLLNSANSKFPQGLANTSGHVGRYITGHYRATATTPFAGDLYPGIAAMHPLFTDQFMGDPSPVSGVRFGLQVQPLLRKPVLKAASGKALLGDEILENLRATPIELSFSALVEVFPSRNSRVTIDWAGRRGKFGEPLPRVKFEPHEKSAKLLRNGEFVFSELKQAVPELVAEHKIIRKAYHVSGGCRMGADPARSVCDAHGRTHDHENLFIAGAPLCVSGGATNSTLTFCALALRTAEALVKEIGDVRVS